MSPRPYAEEFRKAAHDLRTPLAAVTQGVDALVHLRDETPEGAQHLFDIVRRNVVLMGEVLAASLERGHSLSVNTVDVDLAELARDVADLISPVLAARRQTIDVVVTGRAARVVGDHGGLARVLLNLLDNASKYGPVGDDLHVRVRRRESVTFVSVHDHGAGIPRNERDAIFRAFYRSHKARHSEVAGTGLGLSVVREVIERHGGSVGVNCERGDTRVWFSIPNAGSDRS